jgi:hypothetical protein
MTEQLSDITDWIDNLSHSYFEFGGLPICPFAKRTGVVITQVNSLSELEHQLKSLRSQTLMTVLVIEVRIRLVDYSEIYRALERLHALLALRNLIALPSDPEAPFIIAGRRTTHPTRFLVIVQRLDELVAATESLKKTSYYNLWTNEQKLWLERRLK